MCFQGISTVLNAPNANKRKYLFGLLILHQACIGLGSFAATVISTFELRTQANRDSLMEIESIQTWRPMMLQS
jgi:hypothetical protein